MPFADKKTWEDTRPSGCKGSGVAAACKSWASACKATAGIAGDSAKVDSARKAILEMQNALSAAEKKLEKVKTTDSKHAPTTKLISDWKKAATAYAQDLEKDFRTAQHSLAFKQFHIIFKNAVTDEVDGRWQRWIKDANDALKKKPKDTVTAENNANSLRTNNKRGPSTTMSDIPGLLRRAETEAGTIKNVLQLSDVSAIVKRYQDKIDLALSEIKEIEEEILATTSPDDSPATGDHTKLPIYKECIKDAQAIVSELTTLTKTAKDLATKAGNADGNPLIEKNPDGMYNVAVKLNNDLGATLKTAIDTLYSIRENSGALRTKIKTNKLMDHIKDFEPYLTRAVTLNSQVARSVKQGQQSIANLLDALIEGGSGIAGDAKTLRSKIKV
jgi:hypothetical protein